MNLIYGKFNSLDPFHTYENSLKKTERYLFNRQSLRYTTIIIILFLKHLAFSRHVLPYPKEIPPSHCKPFTETHTRLNFLNLFVWEKEHILREQMFSIQYMIYINNKWKEFSAMTHFCSKMHYGTICAGNKRAAEHFEICLPYDFVQSLTAKHTHTYRRQHRPDTQAHTYT